MHSKRQLRLQKDLERKAKQGITSDIQHYDLRIEETVDELLANYKMDANYLESKRSELLGEITNNRRLDKIKRIRKEIEFENNWEAFIAKIKSLIDLQTSMTDAYAAPKPAGKEAIEYIAPVGLRIFFPPILLWDLTKFLFNKAFGGLISKLILPVQTSYSRDGTSVTQDYVDSLTTEYYKSKKITVVNKKVITHDDAILDSIELNPYPSNTPREEMKAVVTFLGNGENFDNQNTMQRLTQDACELDALVIGFNYRGVNDSTGKAKSKQDLVTDGIAQVQRLIDSGIKPENIIIKGHSLGAAVGTLVANHFHGQRQKVHLFNGRSFATTSDVLVGAVITPANQGYGASLFGRFLGAVILKPIIKFALSVTQWEIDAASAFLNIPRKYREYMVVKSTKDQRKQLHDVQIDKKDGSSGKVKRHVMDDAVISETSSLYQAMKGERQRVKDQAKVLEKTLTTTRPNSSDYQLIKEMHDAKQTEILIGKQRKFCVSKDPAKNNGHNVDASELISRKHGENNTTITAHSFWIDYAKKAFATNQNQASVKSNQSRR